MATNDIKEYMRQFGFTLRAYSGQVHYFGDDNGLVCIITDERTMNVNHIIKDKLMMVQTFTFQYPHPRFEELFLKPMREMVKKIAS